MLMARLVVVLVLLFFVLHDIAVAVDIAVVAVAVVAVVVVVAADWLVGWCSCSSSSLFPMSLVVVVLSGLFLVLCCGFPMLHTQAWWDHIVSLRSLCSYGSYQVR